MPTIDVNKAKSFEKSFKESTGMSGLQKAFHKIVGEKKDVDEKEAMKRRLANLKKDQEVY